MPLTGVCAGPETPYFNVANVAPDSPMASCKWTPVEIKTPDEMDVFLVNATSCSGVTSEFEFSAGARSAAINLTKSAVFPTADGQRFEPIEIARVFLVPEGQDAKVFIRDLARQAMTNKRAAALCEVYGVEASETNFPKDALLVDDRKTPRPPVKADEPDGHFACGEWGVRDAQDYWLVRGQYAIFIQLGQDAPDIDPGTLRVFHKGEDGAWAAVK